MLVLYSFGDMPGLFCLFSCVWFLVYSVWFLVVLIFMCFDYHLFSFQSLLISMYSGFHLFWFTPIVIPTCFGFHILWFSTFLWFWPLLVSIYSDFHLFWYPPTFGFHFLCRPTRCFVPRAHWTTKHKVFSHLLRNREALAILDVNLISRSVNQLQLAMPY